MNGVPESKLHGANMEPSGADRTQVGPILAIMNFAIWGAYRNWNKYNKTSTSTTLSISSTQVGWISIAFKIGISNYIQASSSNLNTYSCSYLRKYIINKGTSQVKYRGNFVDIILYFILIVERSYEKYYINVCLLTYRVLVTSCGIHLRAISQQVPMNSIRAYVQWFCFYKYCHISERTTC